MKLTFQCPCLSGDCGFCQSCSGNIPEKDIPYQDITMGRAYDMAKFKNMGNVHDNYWKRLKKIMKQECYKNPENPGFIPKYKMYQGNNCPSSSTPTKYTLVSHTHSYVCNETSCRALYLQSTDRDKQSLYPKLPIYNREDNNHQICIACLSDTELYHADRWK